MDYPIKIKFVLTPIDEVWEFAFSIERVMSVEILWKVVSYSPNNYVLFGEVLKGRLLS